MLYRTVPKTGDELSILGFGYMRLPLKKGVSIDEERAIRQLRYAIDRGVNYVDTAPAYHLGKSEKILARALSDGYRQKVRIATKLPPWSVHSREDMNRILSSQLDTLNTEHIDYYLLHSLTKTSWERMKKLGLLEFIDTEKKAGTIKNAGFSFHGDTSTFQEIVDSYNWDFCQIQYNYLDEHNQAGTKGLEYAAEKRLAVMIMEPLRGGNLAGQVPDEIQKIWDESPVKRSPAEWGDSTHVDTLRASMTYFDDFNLPLGAADEKLWNNAAATSTDPRFNLFFINDQFHAHTLHGTRVENTGDRSQTSQRFRKRRSRDLGQLARTLGNHLLIVRELSFDQSCG